MKLCSYDNHYWEKLEKNDIANSTARNPRKTLEIHCQKEWLQLDGWNLEKWKKWKLKISIFDSPLIVNQIFSQTEFNIGKSDSALIMHFH